MNHVDKILTILICQYQKDKEKEAQKAQKDRKYIYVSHNDDWVETGDHSGTGESGESGGDSDPLLGDRGVRAPAGKGGTAH